MTNNNQGSYAVSYVEEMPQRIRFPSKEFRELVDSILVMDDDKWLKISFNDDRELRTIKLMLRYRQSNILKNYTIRKRANSLYIKRVVGNQE